MPKKQIWFKGNKAAQKWSEDQALDILTDTYNWLKNNDELLSCDVELYLLETHGLGSGTRHHWVTKLYLNNESIQTVWYAIKLMLESRVAKDKEVLRPNVQSLVLQSKHNYSEKKDVNANIKHNIMNDIVINGEKVDHKVGD